MLGGSIRDTRRRIPSLGRGATYTVGCYAEWSEPHFPFQFTEGTVTIEVCYTPFGMPWWTRRTRRRLRL
jgi:hypothetical protein